MKKIGYIIFILLLVITCSNSNQRNNSKNINRIKLVETCIINGSDISIIRVDGKEFLINGNGGIELLH